MADVRVNFHPDHVVCRQQEWQALRYPGSRQTKTRDGTDWMRWHRKAPLFGWYADVSTLPDLLAVIEQIRASAIHAISAHAARLIMRQALSLHDDHAVLPGRDAPTPFLDILIRRQKEIASAMQQHSGTTDDLHLPIEFQWNAASHRVFMRIDRQDAALHQYCDLRQVMYATEALCEYGYDYSLDPSDLPDRVTVSDWDERRTAWERVHSLTRFTHCAFGFSEVQQLVTYAFHDVVVDFDLECRLRRAAKRVLALARFEDAPMMSRHPLNNAISALFDVTRRLDSAETEARIAQLSDTFRERLDPALPQQLALLYSNYMKGTIELPTIE